MAYSYPHPRPALTCDAVVFTMRGDDLVVLLIKRKSDPFKGRWALPGGFVNENESLGRAAARELAEETGLSTNKLEQVAAFGDPGRDPRGHTITVAFMTYLVAEANISPGDDAAEAEWHPFRKLRLTSDDPAIIVPRAAKRKSRRTDPQRGSTKAEKTLLAFDHGRIIATAYSRLLQYLDNPMREGAFELLPSRFTLAELHHFYEVVSGRSLPFRPFKKRLIDFELVVPAASSPAPKSSGQLYRWHRSR